MPLEAFFIDYGKQDRAKGELVSAVTVPKLKAGQHFRAYKISKRFDQDISALLGAFRVTVHNGRISAARIAYGGMAATPKRATQAEKALTGIDPADEAAVARAADALVRRLQADHRHAGERRIPHARSAQPPRQGDGRDCRGGQYPRHRASNGGGGAMNIKPEIRDLRSDTAAVGKALAHDSAAKHVTGTAIYIDDSAEPAGTLHLAPGLSPKAKGRILSMDLSAVRAAPGVVAVLTAADIPGVNDCSPSIGGDPILADGEVLFHGQVVFCVVARTRDEARRAARLGKLEIEAQKPVVTASEGAALGLQVLPDYSFGHGDTAAALKSSARVVEGAMKIGGQEHFYLEGQISASLPGEGGEMKVLCSTQHPSEVQHLVARMLGRPDALITCECRRMGGGFGGKESQAAQWACLAALASQVTGKPAKMRLDRDDDFIATGKRHDFDVAWRAGIDEKGVIEAVEVNYASRCGYSADLSLGVNDRTMFHTDNSYFYPAVRIVSRRVKTDTVSNTAFRGFGGPQGMVFAERLLDQIAILARRGSARCAQAQFLWSRPRHHALRHEGGRQHPAPAGGRTGKDQRLSRAPQGNRSVQRFEPLAEEGHRAQPGQVRHLLHAKTPQPGRRAGACLYRRLDPGEPWRHRDGAGAVPQGGAGRCRGIRRRYIAGEDHRDLHRQGAEYDAHRCLVRLRPQRHGGEERGIDDPRTHGGARSKALPGRSEKRALRARHGACRRSRSAVRAS